MRVKIASPAVEAEAGIITQDEFKRRELENLLAALAACDGKIFGEKGAAKLLGMQPTTLASKLKALGVKKSFTLPDRA